MMAIGSLRPSALSTLPIDGAYGLGEILWGAIVAVGVRVWGVKRSPLVATLAWTRSS